MSKNSVINRREFLKVGAITTGGVFLTACTAKAALTPADPTADPSANQAAPTAGAVASSGEQIKMYCITHGSASDSFFGAISLGFLAFCNAQGVDGQFVGTVQDVDIQEAAKNLERVVSQGDADALVVVVSAPEMQADSLTKLHDQGIPVVAINAKDFSENPVPYLRYIGEDSYQQGAVNATLGLTVFQEQAGRAPKRALFLNHAPQVEVMSQRFQGVSDVMTKAGVAVEQLPIDSDPTTASQAINAYLEKNPDTETIHTGWSRPAAWAIDVAKNLGKIGNVKQAYKDGNIYVTAMDMDADYLQRIVDGDAVGTIDQQPYLQGWMGAAVAYSYVVGYFLPGNDISTGGFVIDQNNAQKLIDLAKTGIRG
jgi:simple sugar transport system substrate-binding protein